MSILDYLRQPVYAVMAVIAVAIIFLMLRTWWRKQKIRLQQINDEDFNKVDKNYRPNRLKELKESYPGIEEALTWIDTMLMSHNKESGIKVGLNQEWCLEDSKGDAEYPMRTRPKELFFRSQGTHESHEIQGFLDDDFFTFEDGRILRWALFERCKLLVPLRSYKVHTNKVTRTFTPKEGIETKWISHKVTKEDYIIEIKD